MKLGVIITAAGFSRRFSEGSDFARSKLDEDLGGRPVLQRTVELFTKHDAVSQIVVAGPAEPKAFEEFRQRYADKLGLLGVKLAPGGKAHRYETVAAALPHVAQEASHIAVHDAARPCVPLELLERLVDAAERHAAVIPAVEIGDTLKRVSEREGPPADADPLAAILGSSKESKQRVVEATIDRSRLVGAQTPQVFRADLLRKAYDTLAAAAAKPGFAVPTDDAEVVERTGETVMVIDGDPRNIKITRPIDVHLARQILGLRDSEGRAVHKRF